MGSGSGSAAPARLTLNDRRMVADSFQSLDGDWSLSSPAISAPIIGRVPGDLISDLASAGLLPEPVFENNFLLNASLWNNYTWTYSRALQLSRETLRLAQRQPHDVPADDRVIPDFAIMLDSKLYLCDVMVAETLADSNLAVAARTGPACEECGDW